MSQIEFQPASGLAYAGIRRIVGVERTEMEKFFSAALPATFKAVGMAGVPFQSPPVCVVFAHDDAAGTFDWLAGVLVKPGDAGRLTGLETDAGKLETGNLPAGRVATTLWEGPYEKLGDVHDGVRAFLEERGLKHVMPCWELYMNDPGEVKDPAKFLTQVFYSVGEA